MRYQQFTSHAYCGAAEPIYKMASQQAKAFCVFSFEVSKSVITEQRKFCALFKKMRITQESCLFFKRKLNSRCGVITDLDTSKWSTQIAFYDCDAILETGSTVPQ
jgi:hypothetical protein